MPEPIQNIATNSGQVLKTFQISDIPIKDKSSSEYGTAMSEYISSTIYSGLGGYYFSRNARFAQNRAYANGRLDVRRMFGDRFNFNGKQNYMNIPWDAVQIVNRIVSGLVGRWMGRNEKISIQAKDSISINQKKKEFEDLEFWVTQKAKMAALIDQSGINPTPQNVPETMDELMIWQSQFQRLPEEILNEIGVNDIFEVNGLFDSIKEKLLWDDAVVGLIGTYTWMDKEGVIHTDYCKPEDMIYSYSDFPDFRDTTYRGIAPTMKISQIRKQYGVEFGGKLTEREIWQIAATSKDYQAYDNITYLDQWTFSYLRPYDEFNVNSIQFELKSVDSEKYTVTTTKAGNTIFEKGLPKTKRGNTKPNPSDNQEVIDDTGINIYRGVYLPQSKTLLEWGIKKNMIRPQDPKEIGNAEFSYSFYMYQNYKMRNIAIPEKIEQPVKGMIISLLKLEQVVAKSRPPGAQINWQALQNIDYGLGDKKNKEIDVRKLFDQTGDIYYNGLDADGKPIGIPITEIPNVGFLPAMQGWMETYKFHYQTLRDQLGEDPNLISQALQPRVTAGNVAASQKESENSTDYIYDGYLYVMEDTAKKVTCLLKDSVTYGAQAYRHLLKEEDVQDRIFSATAKMLPTEQEIAILDNQMNNAIASNKDLPLYLNTFKILRIAKEDVKLAEQYYHDSMKKMLESQQAQTAQNQDATFKAQIETAKTAEAEKRKSLAMELQVKKMISDSETNNKMKQDIVTGLFGIYSKGVPVPPELKGLESEIIRNVGIPLFAQNVQMVSDMVSPDDEPGGDDTDPNQQQEQQPQIQQSQQPPLAA